MGVVVLLSFVVFDIGVDVDVNVGCVFCVDVFLVGDVVVIVHVGVVLGVGAVVVVSGVWLHVCLFW